MHVHVSALQAVITFLYVIIIGFLWRAASIKLADRPVGRAMATIY